MKTQNFNLEKMGVQPMTTFEMQDVNGGGFLTSIVAGVAGIASGFSSAISNTANFFATSFGSFTTNLANFFGGIVTSIANVVTSFLV